MSPMYEYECAAEDCGHRETSFRHMAFRNAPATCSRCGGPMPRTIERPNVNPDYQPYLDENLVPSGHTGPPQVVKSRSHRRELMRRLGLGEAG